MYGRRRIRAAGSAVLARLMWAYSEMTGKPSVVEATHLAADQLSSALEELKPKLRGWLHAVTAPLTLAAGIVLIVLSPTTATRIGSVVFMVTSMLLFTVSAIYHRGTWSPRTWSILQRFDHANIFLLIAGSYTPFALLLPAELTVLVDRRLADGLDPDLAVYTTTGERATALCLAARDLLALVAGERVELRPGSLAPDR